MAKQTNTTAAAQDNGPPPAVTAHDDLDVVMDGDDEGDGIANIQPPPAIEYDPGPLMLDVTDQTAEGGTRAHEIGGKTYRFTGLAPVKMPAAHALLLVGIPTFDVRGPDGRKYERAKTEVAAGSSELRLRNDQVIATLDELMVPALRQRAEQWADHPAYDARASREAIIIFIMERLAEGPSGPKAALPSGRRARDELYNEDGTPRLSSDGIAGPVSVTELQAALARQAESSRSGSRLAGYGAV